jgi:hypothetical protein
VHSRVLQGHVTVCVGSLFSLVRAHAHAVRANVVACSPLDVFEALPGKLGIAAPPVSRPIALHTAKVTASVSRMRFDVAQGVLAEWCLHARPRAGTPITQIRAVLTR